MCIEKMDLSEEVFSSSFDVVQVEGEDRGAPSAVALYVSAIAEFLAEAAAERLMNED